ncbi:MAG: hypothetical protein HQL38_10810 [Alphaproteobacteria bacterium]|nr:hypothetical protein [Alphaproteobacteria bacterium]
MKRNVASYRRAIQWVVTNIHWISIVDNPNFDALDPPVGFLLELIADLFGRTEEQVAKDLLRAYQRVRRAETRSNNL